MCTIFLPHKTNRYMGILAHIGNARDRHQDGVEESKLMCLQCPYCVVQYELQLHVVGSIHGARRSLRSPTLVFLHAGVTDVIGGRHVKVHDIHCSHVIYCKPNKTVIYIYILCIIDVTCIGRSGGHIFDGALS